ncbi:MAG: pseudouridine-5'-phosphate glycosidase [Alphaproteobacteria bacterium]
MQPPVRISEDVADALAARHPVVALETTVIAHGLPAPENLLAAAELIGAVGQAGAVPAVIGILDGEFRVGLSAGDIERLAEDDGVLKVSRRDIAYAVSTGQAGATTVSATMIGAAKAGIAVMATGGIGGVHRGAGHSMDVSTDLEELGRTDVAVVCAGAKAVLDLPRTLEYLETRGVPVIGYGCDEFPAFFVASSGLAVPRRLDTPDEIAALLRTKRALGLDGGVVIANPPPAETALDATETERVIEAAVASAQAVGITGRAVTPYLLERVAAATGGDSITANRALLVANAKLAAEIAVALANQADD